MLKREKLSNVILNILMLFCLILMLFPFYLVLVNSFKTLPELMNNVLALPTSWFPSNFIYAFTQMNYFVSLKNTLVVVVLSNLGLIVFGTMAGYWLIRRPNRLNKVLFYLLLGAMAIPFQAVMIPLVKVMNTLGLMQNLGGLSLAYIGMCCSMVIFLTYGAIRAIPYEIEEAAILDGCNQLALFFRIVFPLLRNIVLTFTILNVFYAWNDYLMPQILLGNNANLYTIQIALKVFSGEYITRWDWLLPATILSMIVPVILFIFCQRWIISGMVSGAVKG